VQLDWIGCKVEGKKKGKGEGRPRILEFLGRKKDGGLQKNNVGPGQAFDLRLHHDTRLLNLFSDSRLDDSKVRRV
jgi:hypothetical protein